MAPSQRPHAPCPGCRRVLTVGGDLCNYCQETADVRAELEAAKREADQLRKRVESQSAELRTQQALRSLYEQYYRFAYTCKQETDAVSSMASEASELRDKSDRYEKALREIVEYGKGCKHSELACKIAKEALNAAD